MAPSTTRPRTGDRFTLVAFHAHPDDEALLTGGTLARAAAEGHRVVLVTATRGERGLAGPEDGRGDRLAELRSAELAEAAAALGCARVVSLGYGDSGLHPDPTEAGAFANVDLEEAAQRLAAVLREERADVLTIYDRNGGYGHPDHVRVHRVGTRAAGLAGTRVVLEATVPAGAFRRVLQVLRLLGDALGSSSPYPTGQVFSESALITHRVRVTDSLPAKRAALAAHASQRRAAGQVRVLERLLGLPLPVFGLAFGREWFIEQGRPAPAREDDVFASLRRAPVRRSAAAPRPGRARRDGQVVT
jgi:LmbE family N-acetylglucosaminyl deacetylase